jgi:hypothetical protein
MDAPFDSNAFNALPVPEPVVETTVSGAPAQVGELAPTYELRVSATLVDAPNNTLSFVPLPEPEVDSVPGTMADDDGVAAMLAPFFHKGYVARKDAKGLMNPAHREEAERRLNGVGLTLAWSPYSRYYGLALADGPGGQKERITNMSELDRNALALLVILWARLVLPQRLAEEGREGGVAEPTVSFQALDAEFGKKLGGRRFEMYVGQLKRLGFLEYTRKDEIKAGPFLDLLGDSNQLASYLRQSTLAKVMREQPSSVESDDTEQDDDTADVLEPVSLGLG